MLYSLLNRIILILIKFGIGIGFRGRLVSKQSNFLNIIDLVDGHFEKINELDHPCKESLLFALKIIEKSNKGLCIIETGSSAWGTNSTLLFDEFITYQNRNSKFSNKLFSCDIRINPLLNLINNVSSNTTLICNDSVNFLNKLVKEFKHVNCNYLIYLDSFDLDYSNPNPSGLHGFKEFLEIIPLLREGTVLIIDDSPVDIDYCPIHAHDDSIKYFNDFGFYPGKGMFIDQCILKFKNVKKVFHKYQIIYVVE